MIIIIQKKKKNNNNKACPQERNIETKMNDKRTKYQQLAFEIRERRKEYKVVVVPIIIGCLGGGIDKTIREDEFLKMMNWRNKS